MMPGIWWHILTPALTEGTPEAAIKDDSTFLYAGCGNDRWHYYHSGLDAAATEIKNEPCTNLMLRVATYVSEENNVQPSNLLMALIKHQVVVPYQFVIYLFYPLLAYGLDILQSDDKGLGAC